MQSCGNYNLRFFAVGAPVTGTERPACSFNDHRANTASRREIDPLRVKMVAPTGVDPVTFRFSVERSTN